MGSHVDAQRMHDTASEHAMRAGIDTVMLGMSARGASSLYTGVARRAAAAAQRKAMIAEMRPYPSQRYTAQPATPPETAAGGLPADVRPVSLARETASIAPARHVSLMEPIQPARRTTPTDTGTAPGSPTPTTKGGRRGRVDENLHGPRTRPALKDKDTRPIHRENEAAEALARAGYRVEQNPGRGVPKQEALSPDREGFQPAAGKRPDSLVEGRHFDAYSPESSKPRSILANLAESKIGTRQTERILLNLADTTVTPSELIQALRDRPIIGLKEILILTRESNIQRIFPFPE